MHLNSSLERHLNSFSLKYMYAWKKYKAVIRIYKTNNKQEKIVGIGRHSLIEILYPVK